MEKGTYHLSVLTYIAVSLVVFLVSFFVVRLTSAYFSFNALFEGDITLGELDFQVLNDLSEITTEEDNLIMPDETISNSIRILNARDNEGVNYENLASIFVRIRPILTIDGVSFIEFLHIELNKSEDWILGQDDYWYYKKELLPGEELIFNDYFTISYLMDNQYEDAQFNLALQIDAVQSDNFAYEEIWPTAPIEWVEVVI